MIEVLRLNHRAGRDPRVTTHLFLCSRAFGASKAYYSGDRDFSLEENIKKVVKKFGGDFTVEFVDNPLKLIKAKKSKIVHLTMYGINIQNKINDIKKYENILIIVGGEKVEPIYYNISDYNISITNQPHSEISSICLFLDYYFDRKELNKQFDNGEVVVSGVERGKKVIKTLGKGLKNAKSLNY